MGRIHQNIKHLRESRNYTKTFVSAAVGKTVTSISDYESGKSTPGHDVMELYANLFSIYIGDLIGKDLWLGEGAGMAVSEPHPPYGDKYQERVERLLHGKLDDMESQRAELKKELAALKRDLASVPKDSPAFGRIQKMIMLLKG